MATSGCASSAAISVSMAPGGTTVSLFSRRISSPLVARIPTLLPAENPRLASSAMSRTFGCLATMLRLSSVDALSTTTTSLRAIEAASSDVRQRSRSALAL